MSSAFIVNSFQLPNAVVDELLSELSGSELKCYLLIVRQTKGWHKTEDAISISQFVERTGLSNRAIIDACKNLEKYGLIESKKGYRNTTVYMCKNFTCEEKSLVNKTTTTCEQNDISPVKKVHTQKTLIQNTLNTKDSKGEKFPQPKFNPLAELLKLGAQEQHAKDWLASRKKKLTQTALNALIRETAKGGISIAQAVTACAERGWESYQSHYNLGAPMVNDKKTSSHDLSTQDHGKDENIIPQWMLDLESQEAK
ncbi:MAG: replication protein [Wohlfahrtiimonas sp.]